jgi:hypothetical protein
MMVEPIRRGYTPDDALPPVEPPSAGFLVQLFLVPALIVGIIVSVWIAFHWLAQLGNDPQAYVRALRRNTEGRWQAALNLANDLRGPAGAVFKEDSNLAKELGSILDDEITRGRLTGNGHAAEQSRELCIYLCRALGEFAVPEAAGPLVTRAGDTTHPELAEAAVEGLAVLATNLVAVGRTFPDPARVTATVIAATRSPERELRKSAAFALGVIGGNGARERLRELCEDGDDNVRYNAALGLARFGDTAAWETLAEMLTLPDVAVRPEEPKSPSERYRRAMIVVNALKGVGLLVDDTAQPPPADVAQAIAGLRNDPIGDVQQGAKALLKRIERLGAAGPRSAVERPADPTPVP